MIIFIPENAFQNDVWETVVIVFMLEFINYTGYISIHVFA